MSMVVPPDYTTYIKEILSRVERGECFERILREYPKSVRIFLKKEYARHQRDKVLFLGSQVTDFSEKDDSSSGSLSRLSFRQFTTQTLLSAGITFVVGFVILAFATVTVDLSAFQQKKVALAADFVLSDVPIDGSLLFSLSREKDQLHEDHLVSLQQAFVIQPPVDGDLVWNSEKTCFVFTPRTVFSPSTTYEVGFSSDVVEGQKSWTFTTRQPFTLLSHSPTNRANGVPPSASIKFTFNYPLPSEQVDNFASYFSIKPSINGSFHSDGVNIFFSPSKELAKETEYTVSLLAGLKNNAGELIKRDTVFRFKTSGDRGQDYLQLSGKRFVSESYYNNDHVFSFLYDPKEVKDSLQFFLYRSSRQAVISSLERAKNGLDEPNQPEGQLITSWVEPVVIQKDSNGLVEHFSKLPVTDAGIYFLQIKSNATVIIATHISVSAYALLVYPSEGSFFVFGADIQSGHGVSDIFLRTYRFDKSEESVTATTSAEGSVLIENKAYDLLIGEKDESITFVSLVDIQNTSAISPYKVHAFTSKPVYSPGENIDITAFLRSAGRLSLVEGNVSVRFFLINDLQRSRPVWEKIFSLSPEGLYHADVLSQSSWRGVYTFFMNIVETIGDKRQESVLPLTSFLITDVTKDRQSVSLSTNKFHYVSREKIAVTVHDLSQKKLLAKRSLPYSVKISPYVSHRYLRSQSSFGNAMYFSKKTQMQDVWQKGTVSLNEEGVGVLTLDSNLKEKEESQLFVVEVYLPGQDGYNAEPIAASHGIIHRGEFSIVADDEQSFISDTQSRIPVHLTTYDHAGNVYPHANLKVTFFSSLKTLKTEKKSFNAREQENFTLTTVNEHQEQVDYKARQTDDKGKVFFELSSQKVGKHFLSVKGEDTLGNTITFVKEFLVDPPIKDGEKREEWKNELLLLSEREVYNVGDTLTMSIVSPRQDGKALLTVANSVSTSQYVIDINNHKGVVRLSLQKHHSPGVTVVCSLLYNDMVYTVSKEIIVSPQMRRIVVDVSTFEMDYAPGKEVPFTLKTLDSFKNPLQAVVAVALVPKTLVTSYGDHIEDIFTTWYGHSSYVGKHISSLALGFDQFSFNKDTFPRRIFPSSFSFSEPLYRMILKTDSKGESKGAFTIPGGSTSWMLIARAVSLASEEPLVGTTYHEFVSQQSISFLPSIPLYALWDDTFSLVADISNYTGDDDQFSVAVEVDGLELLPGEQQKKNVTLARGQKSRPSWKVRALRRSEARLKITVSTSSGLFTKSYEQKIRLYPLGYVEKSSINGEVVYPVTTVSLGMKETDSSELRLYPSLISSFYETLHHIQTYEQRTIEDQASIILPVALVRKYYGQLGFSDDLWKSSLSIFYESLLDTLLQSQKSEGYWTWFSANSSTQSAELTAFVAYSLAQVVKNVQNESTETLRLSLDKAVRFLNRNLSSPGFSGTTKALILASFSYQGINVVSFIDELRSTDVNLSPLALLFLAEGYINNGQFTKAAEILDFLSQQVIYVGNSAYLENRERNYQSFFTESSVSSTALMLRLLVLTQQHSDLQLKLLSWLQSEKSGYFWNSSLSSSFVVNAMLTYLIAKPSVAPPKMMKYSVQLDGVPLQQGSIDPRVNEPLFVVIPKDKILPSSTLSITKSGQGFLYYQLDKTSSIYDNSKKKEHGVTLRRYFLNASGKESSSFSLGETITVILEATVPESYSYVRVIDYLPAGTDPLVADMMQNKQVKDVATPKFFQLTDNIQPMKKFNYSNAVMLYQDNFPQGTHRFTHSLRATIPGVFHVNPAVFNLIYAPSVEGYSDTQKVEIVG